MPSDYTNLKTDIPATPLQQAAMERIVHLIADAIQRAIHEVTPVGVNTGLVIEALMTVTARGIGHGTAHVTDAQFTELVKDFQQALELSAWSHRKGTCGDEESVN